MSVEPLKVVCAIVQNKNKEILLVQRSTGMKHPLTWELPGGKVQEGETTKTALHRELLEELEISVSIARQGKSILHNYDNKQIELIPFFCLLNVKEPVLKEHSALQWLQRDDLINYKGLLEADVRLLEANPLKNPD